MWTAEIPFASLMERNRWKVEFFCDPATLDVPPSAFEMRPIRDIVKERRGAIDPAEEGGRLVNYLSLEHVQPLTGQLINFQARAGHSIKSRSKLFHRDDVLYGRLRPLLNKVYHATDPVAEGICSGEFYVLIPNKQLINPVVLRYLLSSEYVQRHAARFEIGAALPRIGLDDLLSIEVPVPPMAVQEKYAQDLTAHFSHLVVMTKELDRMPRQIAASFLTALENGNGGIS